MDAIRSDYAVIKTEEGSGKVLIPVSTNKPQVPDRILGKWQRITDTVARILDVPTGLVTRLTRERLEIVIASNTAGNPYKRNDSDSLGIGIFCETVAGNRGQMVVQDTATSDFWKDNPHAGFGMKSYCGVPIVWEDGEIFGTFCMLTDKTNQFSALFQELMLEFKEIIETDLRFLQTMHELEKKLDEKELYMREVHHRVKNHFNLLISLIHLQSHTEHHDISAMLDDLQNRVRAISLVHEKLHGSCDKDPCLEDYIGGLTNLIVQNFSKKDVGIRYDIDELDLALESSVPLGLIVAELLSNSLKYAFSGVEAPAIGISMKKLSTGLLRIEYCDNGPGYPSGMDHRTSTSLGMSLIYVLTEQLDGSAEFSSNHGACYAAEIRYSQK